MSDMGPETRILRSREKIRPQGWGTTDPRNFDPHNFRLIVTTFSKSSMERAAQLSRARGITTGEIPITFKGLVDELLTRNSISTSMIDEYHRQTFKQLEIPQALILYVPRKKIVSVNPRDAGSHNEIQDKQIRANLSSFYEGARLLETLPDAGTFMGMCSSYHQNEILIDGNQPNEPEADHVRAIGVVFFTDRKGTPLYELYSRYSWHPLKVMGRILSPSSTHESERVKRFRKEYQETRGLAEDLKIPIIHIPIAA